MLPHSLPTPTRLSYFISYREYFNMCMLPNEKCPSCKTTDQQTKAKTDHEIICKNLTHPQFVHVQGTRLELLTFCLFERRFNRVGSTIPPKNLCRLEFCHYTAFFAANFIPPKICIPPGYLNIPPPLCRPN